MKLFAASATLLAAISAQSIEVLVAELVNKVYQVSDDGMTHTFNAAPYIQGTVDLLEAGFKTDLSVGNGDGVISYTEKADWSSGKGFNYEYSAEGTAKSHPMAFMFPAEVMEDKFIDKVNFELSTAGFDFKRGGSINEIPCNAHITVSINEISQTSKKTQAEFEVTQAISTPTSINEYWRSFMLATGTTNVVIAASAKNACMDSPMDKACSVKFVITGNNNGDDLGKNVAKYTVQPKKAQVTVTHNEAEVFWIALTGIDAMEVLAVKYKVNAGKAVLVFQIVGPAGMEAVATAAQSFVTPFAAFFSSMNSGDEAILAAVYADKVFTAAQGKDYFNFYPIVEATKFESDLIGNTSFQKYAAGLCKEINMIIENSLNDFAPVIADSRDYVNSVTGEEGETAFDAWFAQF